MTDTDIVCLDKNYSTTRLLMKQKPLDTSDSKDSDSSASGLQENKGGLRSKGYYKKSFAGQPLISVVSVVYNGEAFLEETILSIIKQTYDNIEYIVIDGRSQDGTLDIIKRYENSIDYWVSEPDEGIYDAMNKGIDLASGEWIIFMNAGDTFFDNDVIQNIFFQTSYPEIDVIYGHHEVIYPNRKKLVHAGNIGNIGKGSQFSHQSAFISSKLHKQVKYNVHNRIVADYEFFYRAYRDGRKFKAVDSVVSSITAGGLSDVKRIESIISRWKIIEKDMFITMYYAYLIINESVKKRIKGLLKL